jgi:hypothetical protein
MKLFGCACALVLLGSQAIGCGDDPDEAGGGGTGGSDKTTSTGDGGSGGAFPGCPAGSHEASPGVCEATLGNFAETAELANARDHHMTFSAKRPSGTYLYAGGGYLDMTSAVPSIERAQINSDGTLSSWVTLTAQTKTSGAVVGATDDTVVFAGGFGAIVPSKKVEIFTIDDAGDLAGPTAGPELGIARFHGGGVLLNGWLYASGGLDATQTSSDTVERAKLENGTLGAWIADAPMVDRRSHHGLATDGKFLFATGGLERVDGNFNQDVSRTDVLRAPVNEDGSLGAWESIAQTPVAIAVHSSFVHAGMLYLVGGLDMGPSDFLNTVYRAPVGADGSVGAWETLTPTLPKRRGHTHQTPIVDGFLYSVAGHNNGASQTETYFARFE